MRRLKSAIRYGGQAMSFEVDQVLRPELGRDERLLWSAMPASSIRFRPSDALAVPFSVM